MIAPVRVLGHWAYRRRGRLLLISAFVVVGCALGSSAVFDRVKPFGFQDPDSESSRASHRLEEATGERVLPDIVLLVERSSLDDGASIKLAARQLRAVPGVTRVRTPTDDPLLRTEDGREGLILGFLDADVDDVPEVGKTVADEFGGQPGITVGGTAVTSHQLNETTEDDLRRIELFAAPLILLLSLLVFRGFVAALLPLAVGVLSILSTLLLLGALTAIIDIDAFAINIVTGLGLGLAIDYSLFLVSRFREELAESPTEAALAATMQTTGRMIIFSGLTVAVALISLCIFPQRFLYSIGLGGAMVALSSAAVCLLILPALLAMLGPRVNALAPRWLQGRPTDRRWSGLARWVLRHPVSIAIVTVAVMIFAGLPFLRVELTRADASVLSQDSSARRVDEAIRKRFSADPASRIVIVTRPRPDGESREGAVRKLGLLPAVDEIEQPVRVSAGVTRIDAQLSGDPFADKAVDAVDVARSLDWGGKALVGGPSAELSDQRASLGDHLPIALAFLVVSTSLILFVMTGSVVLPVVALAMNALTVSVAFGALVLIFQDGRLEDMLGFTSQMALDTSMPILLFAVAFGLSTDYGVFLLQRIDEARAETHGPEAIETGLARGGRQITAAALLFAVAMGVFAFSELVYVKEVAIGTAIAVLVDATIVRAFLFPAVLFLLGPWAWWSPRWLERRAARIR
jgi:putative drug exporter of the RND superfamily